VGAGCADSWFLNRWEDRVVLGQSRSVGHSHVNGFRLLRLTASRIALRMCCSIAISSG
jgi:hypothetical protein